MEKGQYQYLVFGLKAAWVDTITLQSLSTQPHFDSLATELESDSDETLFTSCICFILCVCFQVTIRVPQKNS